MKKLKLRSMAWFQPGDSDRRRRLVTVLRHGRDVTGIYTEIEHLSGVRERVHPECLVLASWDSKEERFEQELVERHRSLTDQAMAADKAIEAHFRPQVEKAIREGDFEGAIRIAVKAGDTVGFCFMMDTIREAQKKAQRKARKAS